jgi:fimbrial chaperone protein
MIRVLNTMRSTLMGAAVIAGAGLAAIGGNVQSANALSLVPIAQDFDPSGRQAIQSFRLENETDKQVAVSVSVMTRHMDLDGEETNTPTSDFSVFPAQIVIAPRQAQVVRVQWKGEAKPGIERAYRIIAEQQAIKGELGPYARAIQLVVRYVGSLYVVPAGVRPSVTLESVRAITDSQNRRALEVVLDNKGRSHTLLDEPALTLDVNGSVKTLKDEELPGLVGENILASSQRRFVLPWPADLPFAQPKADFKYSPLR